MPTWKLTLWHFGLSHESAPCGSPTRDVEGATSLFAAKGREPNSFSIVCREKYADCKVKKVSS
jgi:hypothetical protein